jgi:hypothetical protein
VGVTRPPVQVVVSGLQGIVSKRGMRPTGPVRAGDGARSKLWRGAKPIESGGDCSKGTRPVPKRGAGTGLKV